MNIYMAGANYKNSCIQDRERLTFSHEQIRYLCESICQNKEVSGCIILSTCNRTEIYITSYSDNDIRPDSMLLSACNIDDFEGSFEIRKDKDAVSHIIELASGLKSQILGEGQIVTQINKAWELSHSVKCTDSYLNVLFRIAVTAGKYVLTNARISAVPLSSAYGAYDLIKRELKDLKGKKCIIIGNGNMGRLMQGLLSEQGCEVKVTIRGYVHGNNEVMTGCHKIKYSHRYKYIDGCDFVVSATKSPHFTIIYDEMIKIKKLPKLMIDLAMPRDIEEKVCELCEVKNINELGFETKVDEQTLNKVYDIIENHINRFYDWFNYKQSLEEIEKMKMIMKKRIEINCNMAFSGEADEEMIDFVVEKTADMILGGMKGKYTCDEVRQCRKKIEKRARL